MNSTLGNDECGMNGHNDGCNTLKSQYLKINTHKCASYDTRLKSFKRWPKCYNKYQTEYLSEAGFFYTGLSDKIECFFCGVRLSNWNDSENPLEQHILWSPNCSFLKMTKGTSYIQQIREKFVVKDEDIHINY